MKILENLKIHIDKPSICVIASTAAIGKTTVLTILAADLIKQGKDVLFISEYDEKNIQKKFS